jgi:uncharacterized protein YneF (UPF0154 family)
MDASASGVNSIFFYWPIINLILLLIILGISIYFIFLAIKALKIYIKKNS